MDDRSDPRPAIGQPPDESTPEGDPDFATEHDDTTVAKDIIDGSDADREPESPRGWAGLEEPGVTAN